MGDYGFGSSIAAGNVGHTVEDIFAMRLKAAEAQQAQQHQLAQQTIERDKLAQQDALVRLKLQETADLQREHLKDQRDRQSLLRLNLRPVGGAVTPDEMANETAAGAPTALYDKNPGTPASLPAQQIAGLTPIDRSQPSAQMTTLAPSQPVAEKISFKGTQPELDKQAEHDRKVASDEARLAGERSKLDETTRYHDLSNSVAQLRAEAASHKPDKLIKVEHKDPETGRTVIEWLPESDVRGKTFAKGTGAATENRLASAQAVNQTGDDIIAKLSNPAYAKTVGPALGRVSTLREFIGNPPPEFAELAGSIESYALANMGVHGMRSAQGAEQIKKLLDGKHTPESIVATIKGLNKFSDHFMQNEGRTTGGSSPSGAKRVVYDMNGNPVK